MILQEIERKYLVDQLPNNYKKYPKTEIEQYYLSPKTITLRLRKIESDGVRYYFTLKFGLGARRTEIEPRVPAFLYRFLLNKFAVSVISKTRFKIPHKENTIELDLYKDRHSGLATVEVEFKNLTDYENFIPPKWFGRDVSLDPKYKNKWLATKIKA